MTSWPAWRSQPPSCTKKIWRLRPRVGDAATRRAAMRSWLPAVVDGNVVVIAPEAVRTVLRRSELTIASPEAVAKAVSKRPGWAWPKRSFCARKRMPSRLVGLRLVVLPARTVAPPVPMAYWVTLLPTWKVFLPAMLIDMEIGRSC